VATQTDLKLVDAAVEAAEVPALLPALAWATGDHSLLKPEFRPDPAQAMDPNAGLGPEAIAAARSLASSALRSWLANGHRTPGPADEAALAPLLEFFVGPEALRAYLPLLEEELGLGDEDLRAPRWQLADLAPARRFHVVVIGAGMSGIVAGHRLGQAGIPYTVVEKNEAPGGTWLENTYPGCRVDVPNFLYSYSFAQRRDWPEHYSTQPVLLEYFQRCADAWGVTEHVRFSTEVTELAFDDASKRWLVRIEGPEGSDVLEADAVISAVGQLNRPRYPDVPGVGRFRGPAYHSARWDHGVRLEGRRVGVIGTGASAVQIVPAIAPEAGEVLVFQRTATWLAPTPDYRQEVAPALRWLLGILPGFAEWQRFWLFWKNAEALLPLVRVDPEWQGDGRSVSALNDLLRQFLTAYLEMEFADAPELLEHVVPDYPPSAKRIVRDDGAWAAALKRDNVRLVPERVVEITEDGVRTADGLEHRLDVLVYATGFQASRFLTPMRVRGPAGRDLHEHWQGDARAYLGVTVPGFPNFFLLYGPNTNIVINGSIIYFSECAASYVLDCLRLLLERGATTMACRPEVHDAYNARIDEGNRLMVWGAANVNSWYRNEKGRISQNWPFSLLDYWNATREANPEDFVFA
jgi:4-hydroxyacetophenone monooxygenase